MITEELKTTEIGVGFQPFHSKVSLAFTTNTSSFIGLHIIEESAR